MSPPLSRRRLLALFTALPAYAGRVSRGIGGPVDQGIGGTGLTLAPQGDESDRGIGGTGVIGTIRRFGSIVVNDLRIAYPRDVAVRIDGAAANAGDLKIGQVVRVVALPDANGLSTQRINVTSEVVGQVEKKSAGKLTVLGQSVSLSSLPKAQRRWAVGDHVAVSGLRRLDGSVVASLIENRGTSLEQVAGPIDVGADGSPMVGGLKLKGVDPGLIGQRAVLQGRLADGAFSVSHGESERGLLGSGVAKLSVEAYVERGSNGLRLGSGLPVSAGGADWLPLNKPVRAVLETTTSDGEWRVHSIRLDKGGEWGPPRSSLPQSNGGAAPDGIGKTQGFQRPIGNGAGGSPKSPSHGTPIGPGGSFDSSPASPGLGQPAPSAAPREFGAPGGGAPGGFGNPVGPTNSGGFGPPGGFGGPVAPGPSGFGPPGGGPPGGRH